MLGTGLESELGSGIRDFKVRVRVRVSIRVRVTVSVRGKLRVRVIGLDHVVLSISLSLLRICDCREVHSRFNCYIGASPYHHPVPASLR